MWNLLKNLARTMKIILILILLAFFASIACNEPKNMEELEDSEDWESITKEICKTDHSKSIKDQIEKCNHLDPYYKFDSLTRQCDKLRAPPGSSWYDDEKGECKYNECFEKLSKSTEYVKLRNEIEAISKNDKAEQERINKGYEKYKCIRKALGFKA